MKEQQVSPEAERLQHLMDEKTDPPNEMVAYHLAKARDALNEFTALADVIAKGERQLAALRQKSVECRTAFRTHCESIGEFDDPPTEKPKTVAAV